MEDRGLPMLPVADPSRAHGASAKTRPAAAMMHENLPEGLNIHYGPSNKTSDSLPTLTRGVAVLMTHPQRPAAMCQWQVKDGAKFMLRPQRPAVA